MICFPNAKINLGLDVVRRRADGYHDIETVMYPVRALRDALEFVPSGKSDELHLSGLKVPGDNGDNICLKALALLREDYEIPPLRIYLHKAIPMGAGLGGGSADAAFLLSALNAHFSLGLDQPALESRAATLGADCAFFVANQPAFAEGIGNLLTPVEEMLEGLHIAVVHAGLHISTAAAYAKIHPKQPASSAHQVVHSHPVSLWRHHLINAFEAHAFETFPALRIFRDKLYHAGAAYAAMTGSGSAVFGLFEEAPPKDLAGQMDVPFFFSARL